MNLLILVSVAIGLLFFGRGKTSVVGSISKAFDFVRSTWADAKRIQSETGIDPRITLVQAAHESNFGLSELSAKYRNLFGIKKSTDWRGATINLPTREVGPDGKLYVDRAQYFKVYPSAYASMLDWADLLKRGYPLAFQAAQRGDFDLFFSGLANGKWGAYAGPADGSFIRSTYAKQAIALLPSITNAIGNV